MAAQTWLAGAGDQVPHTPTADRAAGFIVAAGFFVGIVQSDLKANVQGNVKCGGVDYFDTDGLTAFAVGDAVYLNAASTPANQNVNKTVGANIKLGTAVSVTTAVSGQRVLVTWNRSLA